MSLHYNRLKALTILVQLAWAPLVLSTLVVTLQLAVWVDGKTGHKTQLVRTCCCTVCMPQNYASTSTEVVKYETAPHRFCESDMPRLA